MDDEALRAVSNHLSSVLDDEWRRKSSIEGRATALAPANLAIATLFLAISAQVEVTDALQVGQPRTFAAWGLSLIAVSVVLAVVALFPMNYPSPSSSGLSALMSDVVERQMPHGEVTRQLAETHIAMLEKAVWANQFKGWISFLAFLATGAGAISLTVAFILAY